MLYSIQTPKKVFEKNNVKNVETNCYCKEKEKQMTLKEAREKAGIKREEAAVRLEVSVSTIYAWETGRRRPKRAFIKEMSKMYGIKATDIDLFTNHM